MLFEFRYVWDGKDSGRFVVRNLTRGESSERIEVEGIGSLKKGFEVKSGGGVGIFGGDGEYLWERKSGGTSEYRKQTYRWAIHSKKSNKK